jgi:hypothetical protein
MATATLMINKENKELVMEHANEVNKRLSMGPLVYKGRVTMFEDKNNFYLIYMARTFASYIIDPLYIGLTFMGLFYVMWGFSNVGFWIGAGISSLSLLKTDMFLRMLAKKSLYKKTKIKGVSINKEDMIDKICSEGVVRVTI